MKVLKTPERNMDKKIYPIVLQIPIHIIYKCKNNPAILKNSKRLSFIYNYKYNNYECFNYALKNNNLTDLEESYIELQNNYMPISINKAKIGDILVYYKIDKNSEGLNKLNALTIEHLAIITEKENDNIRIKSKWGQYGIFEGDIDLLPEFYGNCYVIYRRKVRKKIDSYSLLTN